MQLSIRVYDTRTKRHRATARVIFASLFIKSRSRSGTEARLPSFVPTASAASILGLPHKGATPETDSPRAPRPGRLRAANPRYTVPAPPPIALRERSRRPKTRSALADAVQFNRGDDIPRVKANDSAASQDRDLPLRHLRRHPEFARRDTTAVPRRRRFAKSAMPAPASPAMKHRRRKPTRSYREGELVRLRSCSSSRLNFHPRESP